MEEFITPVINELCIPRGLEAAHFKLKWYNDSVSNEKFKISSAPEDSLCYVIISTPSMFEKCFLPFVHENWTDISSNAINDPLDECMKKVLEDLRLGISAFDRDAFKMHDFELHANRRPKVLVQTAGHVSGAVRFYREEDADSSLLKRDGSAKIFPVCLHPKFGGWFALRGVIVLPHCSVPHLIQQKPPEILGSRNEIAELLNLYNHQWRDGSFRNCGAFSEEIYSQEQQDYFACTPGPQRVQFLSQLISSKAQHH